MILGDLIDDASWAEVSVARFAAAAGTLTVTHLLVGWASSRSERIGRLVRGAATEVMEDGQPLRAGLRRERMSEKECLEKRNGARDGPGRRLKPGELPISG